MGGTGSPFVPTGGGFELCFRADKASADGGAGLGLSIVATIAEALGGHVELEIASGQGDQFPPVLNPLALTSTGDGRLIPGNIQQHAGVSAESASIGRWMRTVGRA